jgi:hypothetical protein
MHCIVIHVDRLGCQITLSFTFIVLESSLQTASEDYPIWREATIPILPNWLLVSAPIPGLLTFLRLAKSAHVAVCPVFSSSACTQRVLVVHQDMEFHCLHEVRGVRIFCSFSSRVVIIFPQFWCGKVIKFWHWAWPLCCWIPKVLGVIIS